MPDAEALTTTPVGLALLAELVGLDRWDFMDQIGEPVPGTRLMPAATPGPVHSQAQAGPRRQAADVVADQVAVVAARLDQLASCGDRLVLLAAFAAVMCGGADDAAAAPHLAAAAAALLPVARALAAAPAAQWWWDPPDPDHQRWLSTGGGQLPRGTALAGALRAQAAADVEEERRTARELPWPPEDGKLYSGTWWSPPLGSGVFTTAGPVGPLPAVEVGCVVDSAGEDRFDVWDVEISPQARIWNVASPDDWGRLAARYPRDVTATRRHVDPARLAAGSPRLGRRPPQHRRIHHRHWLRDSGRRRGDRPGGMGTRPDALAERRVHQDGPSRHLDRDTRPRSLS